MKLRFKMIIFLAILVVSLFISCEEDESRKGKELIEMIKDAGDFFITGVNELEKDKLWELTLATSGVKSGKARVRLRYFDEFGWILYGLDGLVDALPNWIDEGKLAYEIARRFDLDYDSDLGPIAHVSTHMDSSELRSAVISMSNAFVTLDAIIWYEEEKD